MHNMRQKQQFVRPAVLREVTLLPDTPILQASIVDQTTVISAGQDVETHDFDGADFNHNWE